MRRLIQPVLIGTGVVLLGAGLATITTGQGDLGLGIEIIGVLFIITSIARGYSIPLIDGQSAELDVLKDLRSDYRRVAGQIIRQTDYVGTIADQREREVAILRLAVEAPAEQPRRDPA